MQNLYPDYYQGYPDNLGYNPASYNQPLDAGYSPVSPVTEAVLPAGYGPDKPIPGYGPVSPIQGFPNAPFPSYPPVLPISDCGPVSPIGYAPVAPLAGCPIVSPISSCSPAVLPVQGRYCNEALAKIIFECQATCEYLTTHLKLRCDPRARRNQLIIVRDCADICGANCKFVPRGSVFDRQTVAVCACICEACYQECSRFNDPLSQQCAKVCCECAKACRAYVRGGY